MSLDRPESMVLFIDGANLHATTRALGFDIDFGKLLAYFKEQGRLVRALYYTTSSEDEQYAAIRPLLDWLDYNGFAIVSKPAKEFIDASGHRKVKGNMDIEMAMDAMKLAANIDHLVLFTGNSNFRALVAALQEQGKRVSIVSTLDTKPAMVADELRRQADEFIDLADLEKFVSRDRNPPKSARQ